MYNAGNYSLVILKLIVLQIILQLENTVNCLAWWRWMSPTAPVVPFSNLLATVFFKKRNRKKINQECSVTGVFHVVQ